MSCMSVSLAHPMGALHFGDPGQCQAAALGKQAQLPLCMAVFRHKWHQLGAFLYVLACSAVATLPH